MHCTVTRQQVRRDGYLEEFVRIWSENPDVSQIWVSLYTPQVGEVSEERLRAAGSRTGRGGADDLRESFPKLRMPEGMIRVYAKPPQSPEQCTFAQTTTCVSADFERHISPCQFGGNPDCSNCGCIASAGLDAIARHRLPGGLRVGAIFEHSLRIGRGVRRMRTSTAATSAAPDILPGLMRTFRKASRTREVRARVRARSRRHRSSAARPSRADPPLQHRLRLLQRVRQGVQAGTGSRRCSRGSTSSPTLGTSVVAFSGGEPMLHPDLDALIRRIRLHGMIAGLITNGYLLSPKRIAGAERRRARLSPDQHRQRRAR